MWKYCKSPALCCQKNNCPKCMREMLFSAIKLPACCLDRGKRLPGWRCLIFTKNEKQYWIFLVLKVKQQKMLSIPHHVLIWHHYQQVDIFCLSYYYRAPDMTWSKKNLNFGHNIAMTCTRNTNLFLWQLDTYSERHCNCTAAFSGIIKCCSSYNLCIPSAESLTHMMLLSKEMISEQHCLNAG